MALAIQNTLSGKKDEFQPISAPKVGMYVCGVTVYDLSHIGHARSAIAFDVIYRYLRFRGFDVTYVRNFTDIDDKIIRRAGELGISTGELTEKFIGAFKDDMKALGLLDPSLEPRCTHYVPQMVEFIGQLVEKGFAYPAANGDVYYRVGNFKGYGKLSGKKLDELEAGARVEVDDVKESPFDFALWKASKPGEPKWPSPWGEGRPGWHIECSVMSYSNLGETLDIHGGGKDLMFPHHENEIAQSEAYTGKPFAKYWIHNGFVNVPSADNPDGAKMSKSLGNFYTIRDVLAAYHPEAVKLFMLGTHYRNDILFTEDGLSQAQDRLAYFYETLAKAEAFLATHPVEGGTLLDVDRTSRIVSEFIEAMDDDFNTTKALGQLSEVFKLINELVSDAKLVPADAAFTLAETLKNLRTVTGALGFLTLDPKRFEEELKQLRTGQLGVSAAEIEQLIKERLDARAQKNWKRADEIRDLLAAKGILLKDSRDGTTWSVKS